MTTTSRNDLAIVTGTSTGIGAALAAALLAAGWTVVGIARRTVDLPHPDYRHLAVDLGEARALEDLVEAHLGPLLTGRDWRRIALVNNAAMIGALRAATALRTADLAAIMAVNVVAPLRLMALCLQACPPATPLRIVNISSGAAHLAIPGLADYCASKAALRAAGRAVAAELDGSGRDAAILSYEPGVVDTPMQDTARAADPDRFPSWAVFDGMKTDGVLVAPRDVVGPIIAFASGAPTATFSEARYGDG